MRLLVCSACALGALMLGGCLVRVPYVPELAADQQPAAGPEAAWSGRGRFTLIAGERNITLVAFVRRSESGELRMVLLDDGGLVAADFSHGDSGTILHHCRDTFLDVIPVLETLVAAVWWPAEEGPMQVRTGRRYADHRQWRRWYGGDPVVLRQVSGSGWPVEVGDYRVADGLLVAHQAVADGPWGARAMIELDSVARGEAPPP